MDDIGGRRFPTAPPDGLFAAILLSFLATAGLFYVNIMAAIVDGLISGLGFSDAQAGNIGSANIYGAALGALCAVILVKRIAWRPASIALLALLIALDLASMAIASPVAMIAIRLLHGLTGGLLVGIAFAVIARTGNAERTFGVMMFVQFGLGGLGVLTLPQLVPIYGTPALFAALALFSLATLAMVPFLPDYPPRQPAQPGEPVVRVARGPLYYTLAAIFLFQCANMALLAYMIRLGLDYGLARDYVSTALGLATWVALAGPALVVMLGTRHGRFRPLLGSMVLTLAGIAAFHFSADRWIYLIANCATGITWGLVIAYLLGMAARFDGTGRSAAAAGFASKMGLASGPLLAGQMLAHGASFAMLINVALALLLLSMVVMLIPAARLDRQPGA